MQSIITRLYQNHTTRSFYKLKIKRINLEIPKSTTAKKTAIITTVEITVIVYPVNSFFFGQLTFLISEPTL